MDVNEEVFENQVHPMGGRYAAVNGYDDERSLGALQYRKSIIEAVFRAAVIDDDFDSAVLLTTVFYVFIVRQFIRAIFDIFGLI